MKISKHEEARQEYMKDNADAAESEKKVNTLSEDAVEEIVEDRRRPITPPEVAAHEPKFLPNAWLGYTIPQLGHAIDFFLTRSHHRSDKAKQKREVANARNYALMILSHIDAREKELSE